MFCHIHIHTEGRSWHGSDILLEKVSGGSGSMGIGIFLLKQRDSGDGQNKV